MSNTQKAINNERQTLNDQHFVRRWNWTPRRGCQAGPTANSTGSYINGDRTSVYPCATSGDSGTHTIPVTLLVLAANAFNKSHSRLIRQVDDGCLPGFLPHLSERLFCCRDLLISHIVSYGLALDKKEFEDMARQEMGKALGKGGGGRRLGIPGRTAGRKA
jgi:hypothetical protein